MVETKCHLHSQYHIHSAAVQVYMYDDTSSLLLSGTVYEWSVFGYQLIGFFYEYVSYQQQMYYRWVPQPLRSDFRLQTNQSKSNSLASLVHFTVMSHENL